MGTVKAYVNVVRDNLYSRYINCSFLKYKLHYLTDNGIKVYSPHFKFDNDIYVDVIVKTTLEEMGKYLRIREQFPLMDIRFVFQDSKIKFNKNEKMSYGNWCVTNGFIYHSGFVPDSWINY